MVYETFSFLPKKIIQEIERPKSGLPAADQPVAAPPLATLGGTAFRSGGDATPVLSAVRTDPAVWLQNLSGRFLHCPLLDRVDVAGLVVGLGVSSPALLISLLNDRAK